MFSRVGELQYEAKSERTDPVYATKLQEVLGGRFGERAVVMSDPFQGRNRR